MRSADIRVGSDYRIDHQTNQYERGRVVEQPNRGRVRIQLVDPVTGEPLDPAQIGNRGTRDVLCPWEDYADVWAKKEARRVAGDSAADALDAALHQRGITPRQGPYAYPDAAVPYIRVALNAADAVELASWLAGMPETVRAGD